jgi:hypothetical protein
MHEMDFAITVNVVQTFSGCEWQSHRTAWQNYIIIFRECSLLTQHLLPNWLKRYKIYVGVWKRGCWKSLNKEPKWSVVRFGMNIIYLHVFWVAYIYHAFAYSSIIYCIIIYKVRNCMSDHNRLCIFTHLYIL